MPVASCTMGDSIQRYPDLILLPYHPTAGPQKNQYSLVSFLLFFSLFHP